MAGARPRAEEGAVGLGLRRPASRVHTGTLFPEHHGPGLPEYLPGAAGLRGEPPGEDRGEPAQAVLWGAGSLL